MEIKTNLNLFFTFLLLCLIPSCQDKNEAIAHFDINAEIEKNGVQSGVIGELGFTEIPITEYPEVNLIQVINRKEKEVQSQASGTRLRDNVNKKDYILTVAHLFDYSLDEYKYQNFTLYVGKNGHFDTGDWFWIHPKLYPMIDPHKNDIILIPINYDESAFAYDMSAISTEVSTNSETKVSIVSVLNLKHAKNIRKVTQTANLLGESKMIDGLLRTDADVFKGISGSPVFDDTKRVVGVVSGATRKKDCKKYTDGFCHNFIEPVQHNLILEQVNQVIEGELFRRIDSSVFE